MSHVLKVAELLNLDSEVKNRLVPAIKDPLTGKLYPGRRGDAHEDLIHRHKDDLTLSGVRRGFYDHVKKKYYNISDVDFDSPALMTKMQRFRKYGTEAKLG